MGTSANGERVLNLMTRDGAGIAAAPKPLGMTNNSVGGQAPMPALPGVRGGVGLNNIGLLASVWGRVHYVGGDYFVIDDGAGILDDNESTGIKASIKNLYADNHIDPPQTGDFVRVTGIISMEWTGGGYRRVIRPRFSADVSYLQ